MTDGSGRRKFVVGGSVVGALLMSAAAAWACTGHMGEIWFCTSSAGCAKPGTTSFSASATAWEQGEALQLSSTLYTLRYVTGSSQIESCKTSSSTFGTTTTNTWGNFGPVQVTMPSSVGSWTACATAPDGQTIDVSNFRNFATTT